MRRLQACRHRGTGATTSVHDVFPVVVLRVIEQSLNTRLREAPRASVQGFFLCPDDGLGIGVLVKVLAQLLPREGVELLNPSNGNIVNSLVGTVFGKCRINLTRAEDDAVNLLVGLDGTRLMGRIGNDPAELRVADKLLNVGAGNRVTEKRLGKEQDQGCSRVRFESQVCVELGDSRFRN